MDVHFNRTAQLEVRKPCCYTHGLPEMQSVCSIFEICTALKELQTHNTKNLRLVQYKADLFRFIKLNYKLENSDNMRSSEKKGILRPFPRTLAWNMKR